MINGIDFSQIKINDYLFSNLINLVQTKTIDMALKQCHSTHRIENFKIAAGLSTGEYKGMVYDDSDVYKILEGIAYSLSQTPNNQLEQQADELIDLISKAQEKNGYIGTRHTIMGGGHFSNMDEHECYNGGHLIEAGVAYFLATKKDKLLQVGINFAKLMMDTFGPDKKVWVPGHQEIEMALVRLGELKQEPKYIEFAKWLIDNRGHDLANKDAPPPPPNSLTELGVWPQWHKEYYQDLVPASQLAQITGHAVRAMYMFSAMADISKHLETGYLEALKRLFINVSQQNMYITGGIGSSKDNEGFVANYSLPNATAYCETCASVGMVFWSNRMFAFFKNSHYLDILEKALYNGVISGLGQDGTTFFYDNPLASDGSHNRQAWFKTSCCPGQLIRFIPAVANYIYASQDNRLYVNTFIASHLKNEQVELKLTSNFPNDGLISITGASNFYQEIAIRLPEWVSHYDFNTHTLQNASFIKLEDGFLIYSITNNFSIKLNFPMAVSLMHCSDKVAENRGQVALQYGPIVYCLEEQDCYEDDFSFSGDELFIVKQDSLPFKGYNSIEVYDRAGGQLKARFIPYFLWNNRGADKMKVYWPYRPSSLYYK